MNDFVLIYNTTYMVSLSVHKDWLAWMKSTFIPETLATGCFADVKLLKMAGQENTDGVTYAVQFYIADAEQYRHYVETYASRDVEKMRSRWGDECVSFSTLLEVLQD